MYGLMKGRLTMKKTMTCFLIVTMFLAGIALSRADDQLIDVVYLKDRTVLEGLIIDQVAGVSVKLATADRIVYTLADQEIDRIVKEKTREPIPFSYSDAVLLKDGVMFRGTIVEQRPEVSIVLQTDNDLLLTFPTEDIWKILKEKRVAGKVVEKDEKRSRNEREGLKIALQIELVRDEIRKQEEKKRSSGGQPEGELGGEIDRLKEQMQGLEEAEEQIEFESVTDRRIEERDRLENLELKVEELLKELTEMLEQCEGGTEGEQSATSGKTREVLEYFAVLPPDLFQTPERLPLHLIALAGIANDVSAGRAGDPAEGSAQLVADRQSDEELSEQLSESLSEIVDQTIYRIPTQEEIDALSAAQASYRSLVDLLGSRRWKRLARGGDVRALAEPLPVEDRVFLYETYKPKGALLGMALNIVPFVYLGSWVQGDGGGALIGMAQTAACVGAWGIALNEDWNSKGYTSAFDTGYFPDDVGALVWAATGLLAVSYAFTFVEPFWYRYRIDKRLKERLLLDDETIRELRREERRAALHPPAFKILPGRDDDLALQLDLVSLSY
jgi:hypothetical protein